MKAPTCANCGAEVGWDAESCPFCDTPSPPSDEHLGWWVIHGGDLLGYLRRAAAGEDPDILYAEAYANSDREDYNDE